MKQTASFNWKSHFWSSHLWPKVWLRGTGPFDIRSPTSIWPTWFVTYGNTGKHIVKWWTKWGCTVDDVLDADKYILERRMLPNLFATSQSHSTNAEVAQDGPKSVPKTCTTGRISLQLSHRQCDNSLVKQLRLFRCYSFQQALHPLNVHSVRYDALRRTMTQKRLTHLALLHCHTVTGIVSCTSTLTSIYNYFCLAIGWHNGTCTLFLWLFYVH